MSAAGHVKAVLSLEGMSGKSEPGRLAEVCQASDTVNSVGKASADLCNDLGVLPGTGVIEQGCLGGPAQVLWQILRLYPLQQHLCVVCGAHLHANNALGMRPPIHTY